MADTPRYLGASVSEAKAAFLEIVRDDTFLRIFDLDGDGAVSVGSGDEAAFAQAVCAAETELDEILGQSHGAPFTDFSALPAGTQRSVKQCVARMAPWKAVEFRPAAAGEGNIEKMFKAAVARLERVADDNKRRLPGSGPSEPTRSYAGVVEMDVRDATTTWQGIADGSLSRVL